MKQVAFIAGLCIFLFSACTKHCPNLLDGPFNDEEKKFFLSSAHSFLYKNQFGDSAYVYANAPEYSLMPITEDDCDRIGNQYMNQLWRLPDGVQFNAFLQHDNGIETSRYLSLSLGTQQVFRYNIIENSFITIEINTQSFKNTMVDSTDDATLSPAIRKIWYGKHTGMLRFEKWNGEVWDRQNVN